MKNNFNGSEKLADLETLANIQMTELKSTAKELQQSLHPVNLLKSGYHKISTKPSESQLSPLQIGLTIGAGLIAKRLFLGRNPGAVKRASANMIQVGVAAFFARQLLRRRERMAQVWVEDTPTLEQ